MKSNDFVTIASEENGKETNYLRVGKNAVVSASEKERLAQVAKEKGVSDAVAAAMLVLVGEARGNEGASMVRGGEELFKAMQCLNKMGWSSNEAEQFGVSVCSSAGRIAKIARRIGVWNSIAALTMLTELLPVNEKERQILTPTVVLSASSVVRQAGPEGMKTLRKIRALVDIAKTLKEPEWRPQAVEEMFARIFSLAENEKENPAGMIGEFTGLLMISKKKAAVNSEVILALLPDPRKKEAYSPRAHTFKAAGEAMRANCSATREEWLGIIAKARDAGENTHVVFEEVSGGEMEKRRARIEMRKAFEATIADRHICKIKERRSAAHYHGS